MNLRSLLPALAAALSVSIVTSLQAQPYKAEYRLSVVANRPIPIASSAYRWAELVSEQSKGRVNIKVYPGSSLVAGDNARELPAMPQGVIDFNVASTINWSPHVPQFNLFSLPFFIPDAAAFDRLIASPVTRELEQRAQARGAVILAWAEQGRRELSNSRRVLRSPADLKGLKLRVVGSPIFIDTFRTLGADPTQMSFADLQAALPTGAVDGQENPLSLFQAARFHQLNQKYVTAWGYVNDPVLFAVSREIWQKFAPADQAVIRDAARQAARELVEQVRKSSGGPDSPVVKQITDAGVQVTYLSPAEFGQFRAATQPVYVKWEKTIGAHLVKQAQAAIEAP
jgi:tripartite ATP-independent transporter DctP family solute receptor